MAQIWTPSGTTSIEFDLPRNKLSYNVKDPGQVYMDSAYDLLKAVQEYARDYGELPNVEDVAYHLKKLFG